MVPFDAITTKNIVLVIWAGGFVVGMSALGALGGAGFQMRFVLPATPALSVLSAKTIILIVARAIFLFKNVTL